MKKNYFKNNAGPQVDPTPLLTDVAVMQNMIFFFFFVGSTLFRVLDHMRKDGM